MLRTIRRHENTLRADGTRKCSLTKSTDRNCNCTLHTDGTIAGEPVRRSLDTRNWGTAQTRVRGLETYATRFSAAELPDAIEQFIRAGWIEPAASDANVSSETWASAIDAHMGELQRLGVKDRTAKMTKAELSRLAKFMVEKRGRKYPAEARRAV